MLDFIKNLFSNTKFLIIVFVIAIFIGASVYIYYTYVKPKFNNVNNKEFDAGASVSSAQQSSAQQSSATLKFFYADWCPHSKQAMDIWNKLKEEVENKVINNTLLICEEIDGEAQSDLADKYNIDSFPTFKLVKSDQVIEYDAKPNLDTFKEFLNTAL